MRGIGSVAAPFFPATRFAISRLRFGSEAAHPGDGAPVAGERLVECAIARLPLVVLPAEDRRLEDDRWAVIVVTVVENQQYG